MKNFAQKVIEYNSNLDLKIDPEHNVRVMNPFKDNPEILNITKAFYTKYYSDYNKRKIILGINPGRLGAGATGIPFTDTKRLRKNCNINLTSFASHEPSSVFIYDVIQNYGGVEDFYSDFFINSVCPLGFIVKNKKENWVNCNYYDYKDLYVFLEEYIIENLKKQIEIGIDSSKCFVLGKRNANYLKKLNDKENLFDEIVVFDHPRYIVQYKSKDKEKYIKNYVDKLKA